MIKFEPDSSSVESDRSATTKDLKISRHFAYKNTRQIFCLKYLETFAVCPDWVIYLTLGKFLKPLATINWAKSRTFLGNFCKGVKICHFSNDIIFGQLLKTFGGIFSGHTAADSQHSLNDPL